VLPLEPVTGNLPVRITLPVTGSRPVTGQMTRLGCLPEIVKFTTMSDVRILRFYPQNRLSFHFPPKSAHPANDLASKRC
jgi:hypothetical protein